MNKNIKSLTIIISIITVAVLGSIFVNIGMPWFDTLNKPTEWIPNIVIPIAWTVIYLTFAIVLIIWQNKSYLPKDTTILLVINGILNVLWCLIFFTFNLTFLGNIFIVTNLIAGFFLISNIYGYNKLYGLILLIYPSWLSIATTLNTAIWILN